MSRLLCSDFKRTLKDKLFLVVGILAVGFAVITPLLYLVLLGVMQDMDDVTKELLSGFVTAKGQFFGAFSFGNNLGLVAPLLIGIILYKDFSYGTIRNKIIAGYSRVSIFLSNFVTCFVTLFSVVLFHALLTLAVCLPFFEYQSEPFVMADFWYLLESLLFQMLVYLFVSAFVSSLCAIMKNIGLFIVLYIAIVLGFSMIAGIFEMVLITFETMPEMENTVKVIEFLQKINIFNSSAKIGLDTSYQAEDVLYYVFTPLVLSCGMLGLGVWRFSKRDLK